MTAIISPKLKKIEWDTSEVIINVTEEDIKDAPDMSEVQR